ncbi:hypothetical protein AKJ53_01690 [candidate division MSBL1 archaeon SCGC-AAA382F02]|uniref:Flavin-dependent thymidylate synthase n=1 Tax=candidate division MSBL1 archaeon SCGC-AAA382F02 TaxID=1698282 RepID=A0A133VHM2_9EURY|nr:hypothetical protein AKJ53_01690 [candidate division MSBL1 archaeon SCGC-AAA382F02]
MKVELIEHTSQPDMLAAAAARSCHSNKGASEIQESEDEEELKRVLRKTVEQGHTAVIEHANFTFSIKGISRACSHQLVRHRIASYSQQSQRHIKPGEEKFVVPPSIKENSQALENFKEALEKAWKTYEDLSENEDVPLEDSRFLLPNATKTNIVVTMNARSLMNFFELRTCMHSQWEIRALANSMLNQVKKVAPTIFEDAGPPCKRREVCPEKDPDCELYKEYVET